jgi:hypothetical protein
MKYRVINVTLRLSMGRDFATFAEAVRYRIYLLAHYPDGLFSINTVKED